MKRIFFYLVIIIISFGVAYNIIRDWKGVYLSQTQPSEKVFLKALRLAPLNPGPFYGLSLFHQWDIQHINLKKSLDYLREAIKRNPLEQAYWINLAKVYQRLGEGRAFEHALENAILVHPTSFQGRWAVGTLLLQEETLEKALQHFSYILYHYPEQSSLVYDIWLKVTDDPDFILEKLVPKEPAPLSQYLSYLYRLEKSEPVKNVWKKMNSLGYKIGRRETLQQIEFLISHGEPYEAYEVWKTTLQKEGWPIPSDGNLITNGGFEKEKILGGGFDWKIEGVSGAKISFDPSVAFEGKYSLKIVFTGGENVDFHHVSQFVALKPDADYVLRAHIKTKAVTTKSGSRIEVYGIGSALYKSSESLVGDNDWKELSVAFGTPPQLRGGVVRVRREKTEKFDRLISGTIWLDRVQLTEVRH